jgi:hypothetical protein
MNKHIYKYSLENTFFQLINSPNRIKKVVRDGLPALEWKENDESKTSWAYDDEDQRDNDYQVIHSYYN